MGPKKEFAEFANKILIGALAASAVGAGAGKVYDYLKLKDDQNSSYKNMFKKVPQLKEYDKETVDDYYQIVKQFAPHMATNPHVLGNLVNKMILNDGVDHRLIGDIADISNNVNKPQREGLNEVFQTTIKPFIPTSGMIYGEPDTKKGDEHTSKPHNAGSAFPERGY